MRSTKSKALNIPNFNHGLQLYNPELSILILGNYKIKEQCIHMARFKQPNLVTQQFLTCSYQYSVDMLQKAAFKLKQEVKGKCIRRQSSENSKPEPMRGPQSSQDMDELKNAYKLNFVEGK